MPFFVRLNEKVGILACIIEVLGKVDDTPINKPHPVGWGRLFLINNWIRPMQAVTLLFALKNLCRQGRQVLYKPLGLSVVLTTTLICFALLITQAHSQAVPGNTYSLGVLLRCTHDPELLRAFRVMEQSIGAKSLQGIVAGPVRVLFKDMSLLGKGFKGYDALSWMSFSGERVIFINEKHRNAPPEALAALISHEALHADEQNSMQEEILSWQFEAQVWQQLKAKNATLGQIPAGIYSLVDRENRIAQEAQNGTLETLVRGNPGYRGLPESSPGYEKASTD